MSNNMFNNQNNNQPNNPFRDLSNSITSSKSYSLFIRNILDTNRRISGNLSGNSNNQCKSQQGMNEQVHNEEVENRNIGVCEEEDVSVSLPISTFTQVTDTDLSLYPPPPVLSATDGPLNGDDISQCCDYLKKLYYEYGVKSVYALYDLMRGRLHYDYITFILCYLGRVEYSNFGYKLTEETKNMLDGCGIVLECGGMSNNHCKSQQGMGEQVHNEEVENKNIGVCEEEDVSVSLTISTFTQVTDTDLSLYPPPPVLSATDGPLNGDDISQCCDYLKKLYYEYGVKSVYALYDLMRGRLHYDYITFILCYLGGVEYSNFGYEVTEETKNMLDGCGIVLK